MTCNYDMKIARELIDVVRESGADAIKFIFWFPDEIMSDKTITYTYETLEGTVSENMYEMLSKLRFSLDQWKELKAYADKKEVILFSTVNSPGGIAYAEALGLEAYKLSSWDYNYLPLWRQIASLGKPMLIDTGPVNTLEIAKTMQLIKEAGNDQSVLLHCIHTEKYEEINMRSIPYMRSAFNTLVGYSSKGRESETDIMAVTLGAAVLEKRLTISRQLPGHHHVLSMEPREFRDYVKLMRNVQPALGENDLKPSPADLEERKRWFRHLVAVRPIRKGTQLTMDMLDGKRPEKGISPEFLEMFIGKEAKRDIGINEALTWEDIG